MQMPGMDGVELAHAINVDQALASMPLILLTSHGNRGEAKMAHDSGFAAYLTKPLRHDQLYQCLRRVMGKPGNSEESEVRSQEQETEFTEIPDS